MNNNQFPYGYTPINNELGELQRKVNNLENRINRLENMIYSNNKYNGYNNPTFMNGENRDYTTGNYIL